MNLSLLRLIAIAPAAVFLSASHMLAGTGDLDFFFNPGSGPNGIVYDTAVQPDGKVIIGGAFTSYNGTARNHIARLNANGSLDETFNVGNGANDTVYAVAIQTDGKILIAGEFTLVQTYHARRIARLNTNGTIDSTFDGGGGFFGNENGGADWTILAMTLQSDGKIMISGIFSTYRGVTRNRMARVNSDGTLDPTFDPGAGPNTSPYAIAVAGDGKIYITGLFETFNGVARKGIARLNSNGSVDLSFNPGNGPGGGNGRTLLLQPDGKIVFGGSFSAYNGTTARKVIRLNTNGSLDTSFATAFPDGGSTIALALQPDGKIIAGGRFGSPIPAVTRLNPDGSFDQSFTPSSGPNDFVESLSLAPNNKIVIGGHFTSYDGLPRPHVARVLGYTPPALRNIATRSVVQTGDRVAIAGFIITGSGPKEVLLRGIGPSLTALGVPNALQDPQIELYNSSAGLVNSNNNWRDRQENVIAETTLQPSDNREAALLITLGTGSYTVMLKGVNQTTGNGLIEVYDLTGGTTAKLANISTRAFVGTGDNVLIGGFILEGDDARVVVRAIGPSLTSVGVAGALADPRLALYDGNGGLVGFNLNWRDGQEAEIAATGLQPSNNLEAAVIVTLQAGNYTAIVEGFDETTGVGSVEVYNVSP